MAIHKINKPELSYKEIDGGYIKQTILTLLVPFTFRRPMKRRTIDWRPIT